MIVPLAELVRRPRVHQARGCLREILRSYRRSLRGDHRHLIEGFHFASAARKVVGVGSVGTRAWIVLMLGNGERGPAPAAGQGGPSRRCSNSSLEEQAREPRATRGRGPAADAVGERCPARLGPVSGPDGSSRDFYVRQLWDGKGSAAAVDAMDALRHGQRYAAAVRLDSGACPRPVGGRDRGRGVPRNQRYLRSRPPRSPRPQPTRTTGTHAALQAAVASGRVTAESDAPSDIPVTAGRPSGASRCLRTTPAPAGEPLLKGQFP